VIGNPKGLVQQAGPLHATALAAIHERAFDTGDVWNAAVMAGQLGMPGVKALIAGSSGMIMVRLARDEAEILTLAVVPEHRQQGVGSALLAAAAEAARSHGAEKLFLEVSTRNPAARGLYQAAGFVQVGRRRAYYADGSDALVLSLSLKSGR
jgi:ribosomal-protein-alanine N-acetyltransferase